MRSLPAGWAAESRVRPHASCPHPPERIVVVGNIDGFKTLRCDRCGDDIVVVPDGMLWDHRNQIHRPRDARQPRYSVDKRSVTNAWEYL